jgi:hypothetical protein
MQHTVIWAFKILTSDCLEATANTSLGVRTQVRAGTALITLNTTKSTKFSVEVLGAGENSREHSYGRGNEGTHVDVLEQENGRISRLFPQRR